MGFHYDASQGTITTALHCTSSVIPKVLKRSAFWLFLFIHLTVVVLYNQDIIPRKAGKVPYTKVEWKEVEVITGITTFFQVFYISQCYARYATNYKHVREMISQLTTVLFDIRLRVKAAAAGHARCASRYLLAAAMLFFLEANPHVKLGEGHISVEADDGGMDCGLTSRGSEDTDSVSHPDLQVEAARSGLNKLLKPTELMALQNIQRRHRPLVLLEWAIEVNQQGYKKAKVPANTQQAICARILDLNHIMRELIDLLSLPVPFQYFHLLNMMVCVNIFVWAYAMGASDALGGTFIFIAAELIFMGMMELASDLADPFGDDEVDFPTQEWFHEVCSRADTLLEYKYDGEKPETWEALLAAETPLGLGLDYSKFGKKGKHSA